MGYLVNNVCYLDSVTATAAFLSSIPPTSIMNFDGSSDVISFESTGIGRVPTWFRVKTHYDSLGNSNIVYSIQVIPSFPECDPLQSFNDGLIVGSALLVAVVTAVIFGIISKAK